MSLIKPLASLKLTLPLMLLLLAAVLFSYRFSTGSTLWIAIPLLMLALNLLAALVINPRFRRQSGLMVFHLCLLAFLLLAALGQLTSLKGRIELTEGQWFDNDQLQLLAAGPWHPKKQLEKIAFRQDAIRVNYHPGLLRGETRSEVLLNSLGGKAVKQVVGDNVPIRVAGYRFYTSSNKGFALLLTWQGEDGSEHTGSVNLPSYPLNDWQLERQWTTPAGEKITLQLKLDKAAPAGQSWLLSQQMGGGELSAIISGQASTMEAGQWVSVKQGRISFDDVRMWMGYEVFFNPVLPWLFATALVGICGLGFHYWSKFRLQSEADILRRPAEKSPHGQHVTT